jgi:predicted NBD/HSP70 family sugar kinase
MEGDSVLRPQQRTDLPVAREKNRRVVLQQLVTAGRASRADLARLTGLSKATVSEITAVLLDEGLVIEDGVVGSSGGKPPTMLKVARAGRVVVAFDITQSTFSCATFGLDGKLLGYTKGTVLNPEGSEAVSELNRLMVSALGDVASPPLGVGIAVPGEVDLSGVVQAAALAWEGLALRETMEDLFDLPAFVTRAADAAAVAEFTRRPDWGDDTMIYLQVGQEMSVGLVMDGRLKRGAGALPLSGSANPADIAEQLLPLLTVFPDARVVMGGEASLERAFVGAVDEAVCELLPGHSRVLRSLLGERAVLLGAAGMVVVEEMGVVWR